MEFKTCVQCNECKTVKQFSLRYRDICRSCVSAYIREHGDVAEEKAVSFFDMVTDRPVESILLEPKSKPRFVKKKPVVDHAQLISKPSRSVAEGRGYKVLSVPKPKVSSMSPEFTRLSEKDKQEILRIEYMLKRMKINT